jgi:hypothetical protein
MAPVRASNRCDVASVSGGREPVVNSGADAATLDRWIACTMMTRDQQNHSVAAHDRLLEGAINGDPGGVEIHSVKIEHSIRLDDAAPQSLFPAAVERPFTDGNQFSGSDRGCSHDKSCRV